MQYGILTIDWVNKTLSIDGFTGYQSENLSADQVLDVLKSHLNEKTTTYGIRLQEGEEVCSLDFFDSEEWEDNVCYE